METPVPLDRSSHTHLAETLDDSGDIVLFVRRQTDARLLITDCNKTAANAFAGADDSIVGAALQDLIDAGQTESLAKFEEAVVQRRSRNGDLRVRTAAGSFWLGYHVMPCPSHPDLSMILGRDITARRAEREQSNAIQSLLAKVFTMVEAGVSIVRSDGRFLMTNPFHDRMLGYPPGSLNGKMGRDILAPESYEALAPLRNTSLINETLTNDVWLLRADGHSIAARMISSQVDSTDGKKLRVVTVNPLPGAPRPPSQVRMQIVGKMRLISLDRVRHNLGDRWPALERKVLDIAEQIIARRLGPQDTFSRTQDQGFLVCFNGMTETEASFKAEIIGRDIRTKLIGQDEGQGAFEVMAVVATVPVAAGADPNIAAEAGLAEVERRALQSGKNLTPEVQIILFTRNSDRMGCYVQWPSRMQGGGRIALPPSHFDRDMKLLQFAAAEASARSVTVLFPLDYELFETRGKTEPFFAACRALDPGARKHLMPVLTNMPKGLAPGKLLDVVQRLKPLCWAVGYQIEGPDQPLPDLSGSGAPIFVVDGTGWNRPSDLPARFLGKLVAAVRIGKGHVLAREMHGSDAIRELAALGVDLFTEAQDGGPAR